MASLPPSFLSQKTWNCLHFLTFPHVSQATCKFANSLSPKYFQDSITLHHLLCYSPDPGDQYLRSWLWFHSFPGRADSPYSQPEWSWRKKQIKLIYWLKVSSGSNGPRVKYQLPQHDQWSCTWYISGQSLRHDHTPLSSPFSSFPGPLSILPTHWAHSNHWPFEPALPSSRRFLSSDLLSLPFSPHLNLGFNATALEWLPSGDSS